MVFLERKKTDVKTLCTGTSQVKDIPLEHLF
jgi:hypothetical protein